MFATRSMQRGGIARTCGRVAVKAKKPKLMNLEVGKSAIEIIHTALCVEARDGRLYVFLPPLSERSRTGSTWSRAVEAARPR